MTGHSRIDGNVLEGISTTTLWTLHNRGTEAKRSDGVIRDPWAVTLFDAIDYDYRKFGKPNQSHGLRARAFDPAARDYLTAHPNASVVALAEGLQTSFWRLDRAGVADVAGLSIGGHIALWLAVHRPERVGALVLADTSARIGTAVSWQERIEAVRRQGTG